MKVAVGADHAGYALKERLKAWVEELGHEVVDMGTHSEDSTDYPEFAAAVARAVASAQAERGILVCGSGIGMSITANRFPGVRAALACSPTHARLARAHNDANILCLGARLTPEDVARAIVEEFFSAAFEGGRHSRRIQKIETLAERP